MSEDIERRIRERAFGIWEAEGRPAGRAEAHWLMAAAELTAAPKARAKAPRRSAAAGVAAPKRRSSKKLETVG